MQGEILRDLGGAPRSASESSDIGAKFGASLIEGKEWVEDLFLSIEEEHFFFLLNMSSRTEAQMLRVGKVLFDELFVVACSICANDFWRRSVEFSFELLKEALKGLRSPVDS